MGRKSQIKPEKRSKKRIKWNRLWRTCSKGILRRLRKAVR